jgi:hypothetical protein
LTTRSRGASPDDGRARGGASPDREAAHRTGTAVAGGDARRAVAALDRPIFVIGSPRSGTTLLRLMLDSHPRISCGEETHFLREMAAITGRHWPLLSAYGFERDWWVARIRDFYAGFAGEVLARAGKARWAEKDPTYTLHLDLVEALFPDACYVHLVRDGHDVVASFRDRWGYRSGGRAARGEWRRYVTAARRHGERVGPGRYAELRYEDLVREPEASVRRLLDLLGEPFEPAMLAFDPAEHQGTERYRRFTASRRAAGGEEATIYRSRVGAGRASLDPVLRLLLRRSAGGLLRDLGYLGGRGSTA